MSVSRATQRWTATLVVLAVAGCQPKPAEPVLAPTPVDESPAEPATIEPNHGDSDEPLDEDADGDGKITAADYARRRSAPSPETHIDRQGPAVGLGHVPSRALQDRTTIKTVAITPGEFRQHVLKLHDEQRMQLHRRCVAPNFPDPEEISGEMTISYSIGTVARVVTVTVDECEFSNPDICDCIRGQILKWRYAPHVQNVQVSIQLRAHPFEP